MDRSSMNLGESVGQNLRIFCEYALSETVTDFPNVEAN